MVYFCAFINDNKSIPVLLIYLYPCNIREYVRMTSLAFLKNIAIINSYLLDTIRQFCYLFQKHVPVLVSYFIHSILPPLKYLCYLHHNCFIHFGFFQAIQYSTLDLKKFMSCIKLLPEFLIFQLTINQPKTLFHFAHINTLSHLTKLKMKKCLGLLDHKLKNKKFRKQFN